MKNEKVEPEDLHVATVVGQLKFLQGKVLTIVEAAIQGDRQLKATKDIINRAFSEQMTVISTFAYPQLPIYSREMVEEMGVDVSKVERELEEGSLDGTLVGPV